MDEHALIAPAGMDVAASAGCGILGRRPGASPAATRAGLDLERELWGKGYQAIAGVDEAGRGSWAGPVVAAAVILPQDAHSLAPMLGRVDDSKRLGAATRARLFDVIRCGARADGVGFGQVEEIDSLGIAEATRLAMARAIEALAICPDFVLLDYVTLPRLRCPQRGIPHGDALSLSIAAASIIAKVTRDRFMVELDARCATYGFAAHKGYGTAAHRAALGRAGPSPFHRLTFRPVAAAILPGTMRHD